jgi:molecular chaperone GrpE
MMQETPELTAGPQDKPEEQPATTAAEEEQAAPAGETEAGEKAAARETMPGLEKQFRQAELAAQEHHDAWLRAKAEADNIRKRAQFEIANAHKFAVENFAGELLAVIDSLEAALAADNATAESMKSGVELTLRQLKSVFGKFSLAEINPAGQKFDPHRHQAIATVESDAEPNTVVQVLQKGYLLHERVIRPALVTVAQSKAVES